MGIVLTEIGPGKTSKRYVRTKPYSNYQDSTCIGKFQVCAAGFGARAAKQKELVSNNCLLRVQPSRLEKH